MVHSGSKHQDPLKYFTKFIANYIATQWLTILAQSEPTALFICKLCNYALAS